VSAGGSDARQLPTVFQATATKRAGAASLRRCLHSRIP